MAPPFNQESFSKYGSYCWSGKALMCSYSRHSNSGFVVAKKLPFLLNPKP